MENNRSKPLILMVDDVPKNLEVLGNILSREEYDLSVAINGLEALERIGEIKPDLILLDIMMPEIDGYEVCRQLQSVPETKEIPVIFLTALTETGDIVKGFHAGAVDYVTKPFNSAELLARVSTHLALKNARDDLKQALAEVKQLSGLLPICSYCKNIRNDEGYWQKVEAYMASHGDVEFSHGICPDCYDKAYAKMMDEYQQLKKGSE